jgi:hypothetical protein
MRLATRATAAAVWKERTMELRTETRARGVAGGLVLVGVGVVALLARQTGLEFGTLIDAGWPLFVIVPGVVLLGAAFVPSPPDGLGFAVAGSVVTTVGAILLYQQTSGNWESWAYMWALIPLAAGLGISVYGARTGDPTTAGAGIRLAAIAGALFLAGSWYFTTVFETGESPIDIQAWWPVLVVGVGALVLARAVLMPAAPPRTPTSADAIGGDRP